MYIYEPTNCELLEDYNKNNALTHTTSLKTYLIYVIIIASVSMYHA